jgi:hypothetical protein
MSILNKKSFYNLLTWGRKNHLNNVRKRLVLDGEKYNHRYFRIREYNDGDYWYVETLHGDGFYSFPLSTLVPDDILQKIKNKEITLIICNHQEAYHCIVEEIYQYVIQDNNIPPEQILLLSNSADIHKEIDIISKNFNLLPIKADFISEFELMANEYITWASRETNPNKYYATPTLENKVYEKKYLSYNGLNRIHRMMLVALLDINDILTQGLVSYNTYKHTADTYEPSGLENFNTLTKFSAHNPVLHSLLENNKEKILNLKTIQLDKSSLIVQMPQYHQVTVKFYKDTYFSVVTETLCVPEWSAFGKSGIGREVSEKTWKAIVNNHPFILVAVPGTLKLLKELGYKTFSPFINEDYDEVEDYAERILMIVSEIKRLINLSPSELTNFLQGCKEITNFNFNVLLNKTNFSYKLNY